MTPSADTPLLDSPLLDTLLLDTSAAIAYVDPDHVAHAEIRAVASGRPLGLAGHAVFETLSVLTRLPAPKRISGSDAARLVRRNFPESRFLEVAVAEGLLAEFAERGVIGGAVYDGLVGAAARSSGCVLVSCDRRARETYDALGVTYRLIG